jgi:two-component system chemotaxis response regulator CheY
VFSLGSEEYALPIGSVQEIIRYTEPRSVASDAVWIRRDRPARCRLIQLVPNAFVVRMTTALDELGSVARGDPRARVGRARPCAVALRPGGGRADHHQAAGPEALPLMVDGTDWAVRIETILPSSDSSTESQMEVAAMARVLVVDDAAFMRKMVSDALAKGGHEVVGEAGNGAEAIARYQELKPEVTTLDITMPEKDGITALKEIIELDPSARVVMCSALGQESKVLESIKLGAKDFVVKPFQADRVLEAVGKALG